MPIITLDKHYSRWKPPLGAEIDWGHPLARGLIRFWTFPNGRPYDLARRSTATPSATGTPDAAISALGDDAVYLAGADSESWQVEPASALGFTDGITVLAWHCPLYRIGGTYPYIAIKGQFFYPFALRVYEQSSSVFRADVCIRTNTSAYYGQSSTYFDWGQWYQQAGTWSAADPNARVFLNGGQVGTTGASGATLNDLSSQTTVLGRQVADSQPYTGTIDHVVLWTRQLAAAEILQLYVEPFCCLI